MGDTVFGTCSRCGGGSLPSLEGADAVQDSNQKQELFLYLGEWWCERCIENDKNDLHDERESEKMARDESARNSMGFE